MGLSVHKNKDIIESPEIKIKMLQNKNSKLQDIITITKSVMITFE